MQIGIEKIGSFDNTEGTIIDTAYDLKNIYVLFSNSVKIYNSKLRKVDEIKNSKSGAIAKHIAVDNSYLYIAYSDGTVELRIIKEEYDLLRITSDKDPGGPGNPSITNIYPTPHYLLVQTVENGVLIYIQPSILFYKWIMIGSYTSITQMSINHQHLYVLTEDYEVHFLDFNKHQIIECTVMDYEYVDIEYDGTYLYLATKSAIIRFDPENRYRINWQYNLQNHEIKVITIIKNILICALSNNNILVFHIMDNPTIKTQEEIRIENLPEIIYKLKYSYFKNRSLSNNSQIDTIIPLLQKNELKTYRIFGQI